MCDRARRTVVLRSPAPVSDRDLVHPGLWPAAAVFARWSGAETLHAGAFVSDRGAAWAVLGCGGSGKSSLLASLALAGRQVLCDDLVVIDGGDCLAGPRCIDLRPRAAAALGVEDRVAWVRVTDRRRLRLASARGRVALRGLIHLAWADRVALERLAPNESLALLAAHRRVVGLGADLGHLLDLAGLPTLRLLRPKSWSALSEAREALLAGLTETP